MSHGPAIGDAFGLSLIDALAGRPALHVVERDDGYLDGFDSEIFLREPEGWPEGEAQVLEHVVGTVLDVGAGAGRYALALQERGHQVVGFDISPGAVQVSRERGVAQVFIGTIFEHEPAEPYDTVLMGGHNLALLASPSEAGRVLDAIRRVLGNEGRIVGTCRDPYQTDAPEHTAYHALNKERGRPAGQLTLRVRYQRLATEWFDYWFMSPAELEEIAAASGLQLVENIPIFHGSYIAVLE